MTGLWLSPTNSAAVNVEKIETVIQILFLTILSVLALIHMNYSITISVDNDCKIIRYFS